MADKIYVSASFLEIHCDSRVDIIDEADGQRYKRTYAFQIYRVRLISKQQWNPQEDLDRPPEVAPMPEEEPAPASLYARFKATVRSLKERVFGR